MQIVETPKAVMVVVSFATAAPHWLHMECFGSPKLILASSSPRRQELLRNARITFDVRPADIDESRRDSETAHVYAERLAREKATAVLTGADDGTIVLGADTTVCVDEEPLGKPENEADAERMLRLLSGRTHQVITGVCVAGKGFADVASETTTVYFDRLTKDEIRSYVATGEPMDKAGAYAIQGVASRWIGRIEGDYFNVVGLPVALAVRMLRKRGVL